MTTILENRDKKTPVEIIQDTIHVEDAITIQYKVTADTNMLNSLFQDYRGDVIVVDRADLSGIGKPDPFLNT